jgi:hypothetical protein
MRVGRKVMRTSEMEHSSRLLRAVVMNLRQVRRMESLRDDIELLRRKQLDCELSARAATDLGSRYQNTRRAKLYRELVEEAEASLREKAASRFRAAS